MQALYQLSYSPSSCAMRRSRISTVSPGFPGGDANITRSSPWTTKSIPRCADNADMRDSVGLRDRDRAPPCPPPCACRPGACLLSFAAFWWAQRAAHVSMIDLMVYRAEGETVRAGGDLYALRTTEAHLADHLPAVRGVAVHAADAAGHVYDADSGDGRKSGPSCGVRGLVATAVDHARMEGLWWASAAAVWCEPVWTTVRYGQINPAARRVGAVGPDAAALGTGGPEWVSGSRRRSS